MFEGLLEFSLKSTISNWKFQAVQSLNHHLRGLNCPPVQSNHWIIIYGDLTAPLCSTKRSSKWTTNWPEWFINSEASKAIRMLNAEVRFFITKSSSKLLMSTFMHLSRRCNWLGRCCECTWVCEVARTCWARISKMNRILLREGLLLLFLIPLL